MAKAVIGSPFTFTVLFLDGLGNPVIPSDPTLEGFYFVNGVKQILVPAGTPMFPVVGDPGRYVYTVVIPSSLSDTVQVYGMMQCTDPATLTKILVEQSVDLFGDSGGGGSGLRVSFVKAGVC